MVQQPTTSNQQPTTNRAMLNNKLEIVLYHPQIPQNTGNIGRLCVNTNIRLNLIKPLGFSLEEKHIRRSGLDYWQHLNLQVHESWEDFLSSITSTPIHCSKSPRENHPKSKHNTSDNKDRSACNRNSLYFFSTKTDRLFWDCPYKTENDDTTAYLVFGSETGGFSEDIYKEFDNSLYTIPMCGIHSRSYNLSNSVAIVLFEGFRKLNYGASFELKSI
jgi:tRNA (cytidine/uridine-2'-O-)-methyltransferase